MALRNLQTTRPRADTRDEAAPTAGASCSLLLVLVLGLALAPGLSGCGGDTSLRVIVDSDIADLRSFEVAVWSGDLRRDETLQSRRSFDLGDGGVQLPASMGIVPRDGDALRRVRIEVTGFTPRESVTRAVTTGFVEGETRVVRIDLLGRCEGTRCEEGLTCGETGCEAEARPPERLPRPSDVARPGTTRDAGLDGAAPIDAAPGDVGPPPLDMLVAPDTAPPPADTGPPPADLGPISPCPDGWDLERGSCYLVLPDPASWQDAERQCVARGGHLVSLASESETDAVRRLSRSAVWTGLGPDRLERGVPVPIVDFDRTPAGLCAGSMPADLVGEGVVTVDDPSPTDDLHPTAAADCPVLTTLALGDLGFTLRLPARSLLVLRGVPRSPGETGAFVVPFDGPCATPYSADGCFVVTALAGPVQTSTALRGPGEVGLALESFGGNFDLRVVALRWTSGEPVENVPSVATDGLAVDAFPCVQMDEEGRLSLHDCADAATAICEQPTGAGSG